MIYYKALVEANEPDDQILTRVKLDVIQYLIFQPRLFCLFLIAQRQPRQKNINMWLVVPAVWLCGLFLWRAWLLGGILRVGVHWMATFIIFVRFSRAARVLVVSKVKCVIVVSVFAGELACLFPIVTS